MGWYRYLILKCGLWCYCSVVKKTVMVPQTTLVISGITVQQTSLKLLFWSSHKIFWVVNFLFKDFLKKHRITEWVLITKGRDLSQGLGFKLQLVTILWLLVLTWDLTLDLTLKSDIIIRYQRYFLTFQLANLTAVYHCM